MDELYPPVVATGPACDEAMLLQIIEEAHQRRSLDSDSFRKLPLWHGPDFGKLQQGDPARLGQPRVPQLLIEPDAPAPTDTAKLRSACPASGPTRRGVAGCS